MYYMQIFTFKEINYETRSFLNVRKMFVKSDKSLTLNINITAISYRVLIQIRQNIV